MRHQAAGEAPRPDHLPRQGHHPRPGPGLAAQLDAGDHRMSQGVASSTVSKRSGPRRSDTRSRSIATARCPAVRLTGRLLAALRGPIPIFGWNGPHEELIEAMPPASGGPGPRNAGLTAQVVLWSWKRWDRHGLRLIGGLHAAQRGRPISRRFVDPERALGCADRRSRRRSASPTSAPTSSSSCGRRATT